MPYLAVLKRFRTLLRFVDNSFVVKKITPDRLSGRLIRLLYDHMKPYLSDVVKNPHFTLH